MRLILLFFILPFMGYAQELTPDKKGVTMTLLEGSRVDYWGRKGIASEPLIATLEMHIDLLKRQNDFQNLVLTNLQNAQEEYRDMVSKLAFNEKILTKEAIERDRQLEIYKDRARRRGQTILIGSAILAGVAVIMIK